MTEQFDIDEWLMVYEVEEEKTDPKRSFYYNPTSALSYVPHYEKGVNDD